MINFQKQKEKPIVEQYKNIDFLNFYQTIYSTQPVKLGKSYLIIFKIRDILFKCYPDLVMAYKKGLSLKKIMAQYDMDNLPSFEKSKINLKIGYI
jgi:hypothetical protein